MHDQIKLKLPYPVKFLGIQFTRKREIGFSFTNLAMFNFRENQGLKTSADWDNWQKEHGTFAATAEMLYASAVAYCMHEKKQENFTKEGLYKSLALLPEDEQKRIADVWQNSQTFGMTYDKKKVNGQSRKAPRPR